MEIIVETSYYQTVYPAEKHEVGSFVGKFCKDNGISPVSYTHLDVYKRQVRGLYTSALLQHNG